MKYRFCPGWLPTLAMLLLMALFIRLGLWQWHKAEQKRAMQATFDARLQEAPSSLPQTPVEDVETWRYRRILVRGHYDATYQILLDNQVHEGAAGYDVITPLLPVDGGAAILVDRGWIPVGDRSHLPRIDTPVDLVEVSGFVWVPSGKFFQLQAPKDESGRWQPLWQNMDMQRYRHAVQFAVQPFVLRMDANHDSGFVRDWPRPAERIETHEGYAYQWFGFAVALLLIYLVVNIKKKEHE